MPWPNPPALGEFIRHLDLVRVDLTFDPVVGQVDGDLTGRTSIDICTSTASPRDVLDDVGDDLSTAMSISNRTRSGTWLLDLQHSSRAA